MSELNKEATLEHRAGADLAQSKAGPGDNVQCGTVLTYGTFDLFHIGHLNLLERLSKLGGRLVVGVSTDEFNESKGKRTVIPFEERIRLVRALRCVDEAIPEDSWDQKRRDVKRYGASLFGIGSDWAGKFDDLKDICDVVYLSRTDGISTTSLKRALRLLDESHVKDLKQALDVISAIVARLD